MTLFSLTPDLLMRVLKRWQKHLFWNLLEENNNIFAAQSLQTSVSIGQQPVMSNYLVIAILIF